MIDQEIRNAKKGKPASMILKMNSLQDQEMMEKLYEASQAGVKIQLILRGICCIVPQVPGISDNIEIISIVDRYLEHARVFVFHNNGDEKIYLSSADWMVRNLSYRIETIFPIYDPEYKKQIKDFLDIQLRDNTKARIIDANLKNEYKKDSSGVRVQSQLETYEYLKKLAEVENGHV
jgi:polyphosphate kinase